ncbi:MAG TPA: hypothetical protein VFR33_09680, partial [Candidatus Dormibacteraeota bacterium]|nr:hypothetical protein [Candidatus Dormibacteraeota bacterium]
QKVTAYVRAAEPQRKVIRLRPRRALRNFRSLAAAVAVLLVLALIAGLILGGRLFRDLRNSPAPAVNQGELHKLESRPLVSMQAWPADGVCPIGPVSRDFLGNPAIGDAPVKSFLGASAVYNSAWGAWNGTGFVLSPLDKRLFLIRARDMQTGATVYFAGNISSAADANIGRAFLTGPVTSHDRVNGHDVPLTPEMVIDASKPSDKANGPSEDVWVSYVGYPKGGSGCIFFQVDHVSTPPETFIYRY